MQNIEFGVVTQKVLINVEEGTAFTPFSPVDESGAIANNGDAYGIVIDALGIGEVKQLVVMTAGCIDKICAEQHYGESYSAEAISALENIVIYDNHKIGGGGGGSMVVNFTYTYDEETDTDLITSDKTQDEIIEAMQVGIVVSGKIIFVDDDAVVPLGYAILDFEHGIENSRVVFGFIRSGVNNAYMIFHDNESDSWVFGA